MKGRLLVLLALVALSSLHPARAEAVTSDAINTMMVSAPRGAKLCSIAVSGGASGSALAGAVGPAVLAPVLDPLIDYPFCRADGIHQRPIALAWQLRQHAAQAAHAWRRAAGAGLLAFMCQLGLIK